MTGMAAIRCDDIETRVDQIEQRLGSALTRDEIDDVAARAVDLAYERLYQQIGQSVVRRALWVIGVAALALAVWLSGKGVELK